MAFCTQFVCIFLTNVLKLLFTNALRWLKSKESNSFASSKICSSSSL